MSVVPKRLDGLRCHLEVCLCPGDFVLDGDPPTPKRGPGARAEPPFFRPMCTVAKRLHGSRCHLLWRQVINGRVISLQRQGIGYGAYYALTRNRVIAQHSSSARRSAKRCGIEQRAPLIFGRMAITLGTGPHSGYDKQQIFIFAILHL